MGTKGVGGRAPQCLRGFPCGTVEYYIVRHGGIRNSRDRDSNENGLRGGGTLGSYGGDRRGVREVAVAAQAAGVGDVAVVGASRIF